MLLWTAMVALYCGLVVAVESENIEWLVLGIRLAFGSWVACHVSAVAAGGVLALRTFSPALPCPASTLEVWNTFVRGHGSSGTSDAKRPCGADREEAASLDH